MPALGTHRHETLAKALARDITHLRPSQMRELYSSVNGPIPVGIFFRAIELALEPLSYVDPETSERVYLFGLEMRQILEKGDFKRFYAAGLEALIIAECSNWDAVSPVAKTAFFGGLRRTPFRSVRTQIDKGAQAHAMASAILPAKLAEPSREQQFQALAQQLRFLD
jgi:hypothetical protein